MRRYGPTMRECAENRGVWDRFERDQEERWLWEAGEDEEPDVDEGGLDESVFGVFR